MKKNIQIKNISRTFLAACVVMAAALIALGAVSVYADTGQRGYAVTAAIPVGFETEGYAGDLKEAFPDGVSFAITSAGTEKDTLLPENTSVTLYEPGQFSWEIEYSAPGDYIYIITQTTAANSGWDIDTTEYEVTVRVTNDSDSGLEYEVWACADRNGAKVNEIKYTNIYRSGTNADGNNTSVNQPEENVPTGDPGYAATLWGLTVALGGLFTVLVITRATRQKESN